MKKTAPFKARHGHSSSQACCKRTHAVVVFLVRTSGAAKQLCMFAADDDNLPMAARLTIAHSVKSGLEKHGVAATGAS